MLLFFKQNVTHSLARTKIDAVLLSLDAKVVKIENSNFTLILCLISSQEEVDTKAVLHVKVLLEDANDDITI